jgi:hypothetical protein
METLSFDFSAPKMAHLLQVVNMQELSFLYGSLVVVLRM